MKKNHLRSLFFLLCIVCTVFPAFAQVRTSDTFPDFQQANFRFIGPGNAGGRISDIEVFPGQTDHILISASSGGIFKSTDGTQSWHPVFDQAGSTLAIGDMAISASNPEIVWAGTGEASGEQSAASIGDGVYKSIDGGETWTHMGLEKTRHISRVRIDPQNPDIVYVAATGARWGENSERGIYKTTDGGQSWTKVLYVNDNTGFSDLALHPNGKTILASAWFQRRNAWAHVRTGPHSGLFRSDDAGETWEKLDVFSDENIGRIALWIAPANPDIIYACKESQTGGLYRSKDSGQTWELMNPKLATSYWYGRLYGNPNDPDHIFVMGTNVSESKNGGKKVNRMPAKDVHVDHHILWINPDDTQHRLLGNDGGLYLTHDGGESWTFINNLAIGQNYAISIDRQDPYYIYGGLQDNGVWGGPSTGEGDQEIINENLRRVCGGDGFYSAIDPDNPAIVYGESQYGFIVRRDFRDNDYQMIKPAPPEDSEEEYRFNWNTPFFISVHPPHALYIGGNYLFKSTDKGENWDKISPDLSKNQDLSNKLVLGQKPVLKPYASITALAESPLKPGLLLAGTDDGNLQLSLDDGQTWVDLSDQLPMPADRFFTRVLWSFSDLGTAYVACGRYYEANDLSPWLFKTKDMGKSWELITQGMPDQAVIKGLAAHPDHPELLFAGSHNALFVSLNGGENWFKPNWDIPPVAIDDIKIAFPNNDLVLGSYGRGIIILDDISWIK